MGYFTLFIPPSLSYAQLYIWKVYSTLILFFYISSVSFILFDFILIHDLLRFFLFSNLWAAVTSEFESSESIKSILFHLYGITTD